MSRRSSLRGTHALIAASALATAMLATAGVRSAPAAAAAAPQPFDCSTSKVILAETQPGGRTHLFQGTFEAGSITFTPFGTPTRTWNATGYRKQDGFVYGVTTSTNPLVPARLLQINRDGSVTDLDSLPTVPRDLNVGAFDDDGNFWVGATDDSVLYKIDVTTETVTPRPLNGAIGGSDITISDGAAWTITVTGSNPTRTHVRRIDLSSGDVTERTFPLGMPGGAYGAGFTYGNGDIGFLHNGGELDRLGPIGTSDPVKRVSHQTAPGATGTDGTLCVGGVSADLSVAKTADPVVVAPGGTLTYTMTVTNHGPDASSGWSLNDPVPTGVTAKSWSKGCSLDAGVLTCTGGALPEGQSARVRLTTTVPADAKAGPLANTATVAGNEVDHEASNDTASVSTPVRYVLTVTASDASMTAGGEPPTVTPSYSGFVNGDTAADLDTPPTCTADPDTKTTTCSGAKDGDYQFVYVNGTLTVNPTTAAPPATPGAPANAGGSGLAQTGSDTRPLVFGGIGLLLAGALALGLGVIRRKVAGRHQS